MIIELVLEQILCSQSYFMWEKCFLNCRFQASNDHKENRMECTLSLSATHSNTLPTSFSFPVHMKQLRRESLQGFVPYASLRGDNTSFYCYLLLEIKNN